MSTPRKKKRTRRKKQSSLPLLAAVSVCALTVALVVLIIVIAATNKSPEHKQTTAAVTTPQNTPVLTTTATDPVTTPSPVTTPTKPATTTAKPATQPPATTTQAPPVTTPAPPVTTPPVVGVDYEYHIDMNEYEGFIDPTGKQWHNDYLLLVNADHPVKNNFENDSPVLSLRKKMTEADDYSYGEANYLNITALKALTAMFLEARAQGVKDLDSTSAYRTYTYQKGLFDRNCDKTYHWVCADDSCNVDWISKYSGQSGGKYYSKCPICDLKTTNTIPITREEQEASVATYSCAPGTSDHQTGLAVDIIQTSLPSRFDSLIQEFGETEAGKWLAANAHYFGFILRFPADKEDITGIIYEPWHFRFVGRTHAMAMFEKGLCLEEYVEYLQSTDYFN